MVFTYKKWDEFCSGLSLKGIKSIPASRVNGALPSYFVLKHDVETDVKKAFKMAEIEHKHGHFGSYYVQAYLMENAENIKMLSAMKEMGHEISYHYDVMDSNHGDIEAAIDEFERNKARFEENGFVLVTVCQHGNPVVERVGYTSNRDFFRNPLVQEKYPELSDIMVDFKTKVSTDYIYFSDAGRRFKMIYDPINNDICDSSDKDVPYDDLKAVLKVIDSSGCYILSTHPHRWTTSSFVYSLKNILFKIIKFTAKLLMKIPFAKKIMSRYYYLAKKI